MKNFGRIGREFTADVNLVPLDPFYEIRWPDGSRFQVRQDEKDMLAEVTRNFPQDLKVTLNFLTIVKSVTFLDLRDWVENP